MPIKVVGGSIKDERLFSIMNFVNSGRQKKLDEHLHVVMHMKAQKLF
jgi:hypothetical protein